MEISKEKERVQHEFKSAAAKSGILTVHGHQKTHSDRAERARREPTRASSSLKPKVIGRAHAGSRCSAGSARARTGIEVNEIGVIDLCDVCGAVLVRVVCEVWFGKRIARLVS